jgi:hypothetical protein
MVLPVRQIVRLVTAVKNLPTISRGSAPSVMIPPLGVGPPSTTVSPSTMAMRKAIAVSVILQVERNIIATPVMTRIK